MSDDKASKALRLMLGSDKPGEVVAARDAFIRLMGVDIHEIADRFFAIGNNPAPQHKPSPGPARRARTAEEEADAEAIEKARELATDILAVFYEDNSLRLNANEQRFLHQMSRTKWPPSPKQMSWLMAIGDKVFLKE